MERGGGGGGGRFICMSGPVLPFGKPSDPNLPPQESFDYPKGGYVLDSWEDVFSSCEGSAGKLLLTIFLETAAG